MTGADLQRTIIDALMWDGWLVLRPNSGAMHSEDGGRYVVFIRWYAMGYGEDIPKGVADVLAIRPGCSPLAVEVKGDGDTLKEHQATFLEAWQDAGGISIVARSLDDIAPYLQRMVIE